jgi:hypothetical protein
MPGSDWTRERAPIDATPDGSATRRDARASFYGQPEELVDTVNSLRLFVSEETEVDRSDPNLPSSPPVAPAVPNQTASTAGNAPAPATPDKPPQRIAHDELSGSGSHSAEPSRNTEPPTVILPLPPPSRAFLPLALNRTAARSIAWRSAKRVGIVVVVVLAILGAGDLVSRLEDAFASAPEPQPAAAVAPAATPAPTTSPQPASAATAPAPASAAAPPSTPSPTANRPTELKSLATAGTPAREAAITPKPTQPTLASQTSATGKATPQNTPSRTPAAVSATTQRAAGTPAEGARVPAASATNQRAATPAATGQRAATPAAEPAKFVGTLRVASQPAGAAVSINGKPIGVTPITLEQQRAGSLAVQITLDGFERWSAAIQVPAGRVTQVNATLRPAAP